MNLDAMDQDELSAFHQRLSQHLITEARTLFPERPRGYIWAARTLRRYAINKRTAMKLRLDGKIGAALRYEEICDRIYETLPAFARW